MIPRWQSSRVDAISYPLAQLNLSRDLLCIIANMTELVFGNSITGWRFSSLYEQIWTGWGLIRKSTVQCRALWSSFESQNSFSDLKILGFMRVYFVNFCSTLNTGIIRYQHNFVEPWPERPALNLPLSNETSRSPKFAHIRTKSVSPQTHVLGQIMSVYRALHYPCLPP